MRRATLSSATLGPFRLIRPLAQGGIAQVWAGEHRASGAPVAVKVITGDKAQDPYFRASFHNEVRAIAALDHPAIIQLLDHGEVGSDGAGELAPGCPYLVMELASGGTLQRSERRAMAWPEIRTVLLTLLSALGHAHARGIVHRDLKPGNVLVCARGDLRPGLKLTDFGLARLLEDHDREGSIEAVRGTLHYMAPEQCRGLWRDQGPWTDLYALGCIAWQLATGRPPFRGFRGDDLLRAHVEEPVPTLPPRRGLPTGYATWVEGLLAKRTWDRPQRAADAAWALSHLPEPDDVGPTRWFFPDLAAAHGLSGDLDTDPTPRTPLPDDVDPSEDPTVRMPPMDPSTLALPARRSPSARTLPPVPRAWREPQAPPPDIRLLDAGLTMLGLRALGLVGRHAERDALWQALVRVDRSRTPEAVVVRGPKGSGISRLSSWLGSRAHEVGAASTFLLTHEPGDTAAAATRRALARAVGTTGLGPDEVALRVRRFVERRGILGLHPDLIAALAPGDAEPSPTAERLHATLAAVVRRYADERAAVVRVEDLHRCPGNIPLLLDLLGGDGRVLLVATVRSGLGSDDPPLLRRLEDHPQARVLTPGPLSPAELRSLLRGQLRLSAPLALQVEQVVQGNPQFAVQLALGWAGRGLLVPTPEGFTLAPGTPVQLPDDLHALWAERIDAVLDRLPASSRLDLERAAAIGERIPRWLWDAACPDDRAGSRAALIEASLNARLLVRHGDDLRFAHPMLRESLLRGADEAGRLAEHHAACARAVAQVERRTWRDDRRLGRHLHAAGAPERAVRPLLRAASGALAEGDPRASLALATLAAASVPPDDPRRIDADLLCLRGHAATGEFAASDTLEARLRARADAVEPADRRGELWLALTHHALTRERPERADESLDRALTALSPTAAAALGRSLALAHAHLARLRGDLPGASLAFERAIAIARSEGDRTGEAVALRALGALRWRADDAAGAERAYRAALPLLQAGPPAERAAVLNNLGECARRAGDLDAAEASYLAAADLLERAGAAAWIYPLLNLGIVRVRSGRHHEALDPLARALEECEHQGNVALASAARLSLLPCCAALGDWPGWTRQLDQLDRDGLPVEIEREVADAVRAAADTALQASRPAEARRGLVLAEELFRRLGDPSAADRCADRARAIAP